MNNLRSVRENLNITQIDAAKLLNISRRTYQKYEMLDDNDNPKLQYYVYILNKIMIIDEEHGVLSIEDIKQKTSLVLSKYQINFCYLFGSYAKGSAKENSDIDLIIDSEITGLDFFGLVEDLRETLHKKIDLLKFDQLTDNQQLLKEIMKDGIRIYKNHNQ